MVDEPKTDDQSDVIEEADDSAESGMANRVSLVNSETDEGEGESDEDDGNDPIIP